MDFTDYVMYDFKINRNIFIYFRELNNYTNQ